MEATALSVGKSVLDGALGYAKSAFAEEVALQLGVQRDHAFIRDELEMMRAFLMAADEERSEQKVVKTWVKQLRDVAYDAEDSLQDFTIRLGKSSWWRFPLTLSDRHHVAMRMKELRAKVEDVSQRNVRYQLIKGSGSKAVATIEQSRMVSSVMSGTEEAMRQRNKAKVDLIRLIHSREEDFRVIAIWGSKDALRETSILKRAYDDLKRDNKFECQAWISITSPFNPVEFVRNIIRQFFVGSLHEAAKTQEESGTQVYAQVYDLPGMGTMKGGDLIDAFLKYLNEKSFLIVLGDISSNEEWHQIKGCFPANKKGSRLIVCTEQAEVASLCVRNEMTEIPDHKQLSTDPTFFAFYKKESQDGTRSVEPGPSSSIEITDESGSGDEKRLTRMGTMIYAFKKSQLIGRTNEESKIVNMVSDNSSQELQVISIWGMGGLGKTTLVKHVYERQELRNKFEKCACVTVKRPFDPNELLNSLATQLTGGEGERNQSSTARILEENKYLIVLDDLSSTAEWDAISNYFIKTQLGSRILVTTRVESIAKHCSLKETNIHKLEFLGEKDACNLFMEKVFGKITDLDEMYPELTEVAKPILKKCNGLPLPIVTIGGFLSKQPKTPMVWRKLSEHIGVELEMNQELRAIKDILIKSYDGLPYHLKSCFLYLSIFPEDHSITRRRLVGRWMAEGYTSEIPGMSLKDIAENYLMELIDRSMILPFQKSICSRKGISYCKIHDLLREISISKSQEENLVFRVEEGCSSNALATTRHLSISSNWKGDESDFESLVDLSRIRSLTVFGRWRPFFISEKMKLLRVLDLEGTTNLFDHHLTEIGKLLHLRYLSLRGCGSIVHLPGSVGNLKQLETLDIYGTGIFKLPQCIIKLRKLQYIRAGCVGNRSIEGTIRRAHYKHVMESGTILKETPSNKLCICTRCSVRSCLACCNRGIREDIMENDGDSNWCDVCTWYCHSGYPWFFEDGYYLCGVKVPRGLRNLKALNTLGVVNTASGKSILQEIKCLTQLRKLAVIGVSEKNCQEFCSTLAGLGCLESLSVKALKYILHQPLLGCLDVVSPPPKNLQSLELRGVLSKFPEWIGALQNLVKLKLECTLVTEVDATMRVLGKLPNLTILQLLPNSFKDTGHGLSFCKEAPFPSLMVLELAHICDRLLSVEFKEEAAPNLELLRFHAGPNHPDNLFSGLASLPKLRKLEVGNNNYDFIAANVQAQLENNPNRPMLKRSS